MPPTRVERRFWSKVRSADADECWVWTGSRNRLGYGQFFVGGKYVRAHRWAYESLRAPIDPPWLLIDHGCNNPPCVNPWHLNPVDWHTNAARKDDRGRWRGVYTSPDQVRPTTGVKMPQYRRAIEALKARLRSGEWAAGDPFLTAAEIRARYDVNVPRSIAILEWLAAEGLIEGHQGKGVYVTDKGL
jgi:hypothetical protein